MGAALGPLGALIGSSVTNTDGGTSTELVDRAAFDKLAGDNESKRGTYTAAENPNKAPCSSPTSTLKSMASVPSCAWCRR